MDDNELCSNNINNEKKNNNELNKKDNKKEKDNDEKINYESEYYELNDLTTEKLEEIKKYFKNKYDINKDENKKLYEEDHNWIKNYEFKYLDNKKDIPGYIKWTGITCSMCAALNALYSLNNFRDFFKKDKLEYNLDNYLKKMSSSLNEFHNIILDIREFYSIPNINLFDFIKKIFIDFDDKKIIISNDEIHKKYVDLIYKSHYLDLDFYSNLLSEILYIFSELLWQLKKNDDDSVMLWYKLDLLNLINRDLNKMIVESIEEGYKLSLINKTLYFDIFKGINENRVININLFKEVKFNDIINIEELIDCSEFLEKNPNLKNKLKYKLKSIIIHCGSSSTGGDFGCFRKDDIEDKYWYFQMNEEVKKYSLEEIINKDKFSGYNTVNTIFLLYELIE